MFYIIFGLVLLAVGTWNLSPFFAHIEDWPILPKSVLSLSLIGVLPAVIIVVAGMIDAYLISKRLSGRR